MEKLSQEGNAIYTLVHIHTAIQRQLISGCLLLAS